MARKPTKTKPSSYNYDMRPGETPEAYYKRLAKVADQRLVRLEELSHVEGYKGVKGFSYKRAIKDIQIYNPGASRFNTKMITYTDKEGNERLDNRILRERTMSVLDFLKAPTSTKAGIDSAFRSSIDTINKKYGTSFTWQEAALFFEKSSSETLFKQANGSPVAMRALGKIQKLDDHIVRGMALSENFAFEGPEQFAAIKILTDRRRTRYVAGREITDDTKIKILEMIDPKNDYGWMEKFMK